MKRKPALIIAIAAGLLGVLVLVFHGDSPMKIRLLAESALAVVGIRTGEQPTYDVIERVGELEIRRYGKRAAAETTVTLDDGAPASDAFRILAGYIFGGNRQNRDIAMTAPVTMDSGGRQIAMTAPVTMEPGAGSAMTMRFFLPSDIPLAEAPAPQDERVRLVEVPAETLAVLRFTGRWAEHIQEDKQQELLAGLRDSVWQPAGAPFTQLYDPPFTIPFLRRNEVAVRVERGP